MRLAAVLIAVGMAGCTQNVPHHGYLVYSATTDLDAAGSDTPGMLAVGPATALSTIAAARPMNSIVAPFPINVQGMTCETQQVAGSSKHIVLAVYVNGVAEGVTADITGSSSKAASDVADTAWARAGDDIEVGTIWNGKAPGNVLCTLSVQ